MNLFTLDNGKVKFSPEALLIKEFKDVWENDTSKTKEKAVENLAYVYFITDYKSPYMTYSPEARSAIIQRDVITQKDWKQTPVIDAAIRKYLELQTTPSMGLLRDAEEAVTKVRSYFKNVDITMDVDGSITKTLISNIEKLGGVIKGLTALRDIVDKEISETKRVRGSGTIGLREAPKER